MIIHKRNPSLDILRIVAVLAVIMIHCSGAFVTNYKQFSSEFIFGNLFDSIARIGVPLFLMISGALFLDENKKITIKSILSKNVKSLAIITITWAVIYSAVYNVIFPLLIGDTITIKAFFIGIINGHGHMWFLYMIMGLYVIVPFLKKFVCKENKGMVLFFIAVSFVVEFLLPTIDKICVQHLDFNLIGSWINKFHLNFFGGFITYFLIGWFIVHVGIKQKYIKHIIYFLGVASLVFIICYVLFTGDYKTAYENIGAPVFIYSVSMFLALNNIKFNPKTKALKILEKFSNLTFGVYIIHILVLSVFSKLYPYNKHCALYIMISFVAVGCCSFLCSYIISKIPILKKIIRA